MEVSCVLERKGRGRWDGGVGWVGRRAHLSPAGKKRDDGDLDDLDAWLL